MYVSSVSLPLKGIRMVFADECWHKSLSPLMAEVRQLMGERPVYLTFDIDAIDITSCPGTGKDVKSVISITLLLHINFILLSEVTAVMADITCACG